MVGGDEDDDEDDDDNEDDDEDEDDNLSCLEAKLLLQSSDVLHNLHI